MSYSALPPKTVKASFPARLPAGNALQPGVRAAGGGSSTIGKTATFESKNPHDGLRGYAAARQRMVQRLSLQHGVTNPAVLAAFFAIERHLFVDSGLMGQAYEDTSLPIGLEQTISKPQVVGRMLQLLMELQYPERAKVLEIGTGCGYQAALLRQLFAQVWSVERLAGLHQKALQHLSALAEKAAPVEGIRLVLGDGMLGYAKGGPYHAIIAAAGGKQMPQAWLEQLAPGGRIVAPVEQESGAQALVVVDKTLSGKVQERILDAVHFVPLKSGVR